MKIGVISAMESEHNRLSNLLKERHEGSVGCFRYVEGTLEENRLLLMQCGIGKVNAALGTSELIRHFAPDFVLSSGVAGGIDARLKVMDVVVSERIVYHDVWCGEGNEYGQIQGMPTYFQGHRSLLKWAAKVDTAETGNRIHCGLICTGDRFITERKELAAISAHFPNALAVDMESAAIAQVCYLYNLPFLSFRIISDTPGIEEHFSQYLDFWEKMADRSFRTTRNFLLSLPSDASLL